MGKDDQFGPVPDTAMDALLAEVRAMRADVLKYGVRPAWLAGYVALGRYIGSFDKKGRKAKAWALAEGLKPKLIDGTPHFSLADVDRAMRNGRDIETGRAA